MKTRQIAAAKAEDKPIYQEVLASCGRFADQQASFETCQSFPDSA